MFSLSLVKFGIVCMLLAHTSARNLRRQTGPVDPSTIKDCTYYDQAIDSSYTCSYFENYWGLTHAQFVTYNPSVLQDCSGIKVGNSYCVEENHGQGPSKTTTSTSTVVPTSSAAPSPTQSGLVSDCTSFYKVKSGDGCQVIVDSYGTFTLSDFYTWNPAVGSDCRNLQAGYYVCVGVPATPSSRPTSSTGPFPTQTGIASNCQKYYKAVSGDTCQIIVNKYSNFSLSDFFNWNPAVGPDCANLIAGDYYCVGAPGSSTTTPTAAGPSPTQTGIISTCKTYYQAISGDSCQIIVNKYGTFSLADFYAWNPAVGSNCANLIAGDYYCVGVPGTPTSRPTKTSGPTPSNSAPSPTEPGTTTSCKKYYKVASGDTCAVIEAKFGISASAFSSWNPNVGSSCTGLWLDYYVCVGI